MKLMKYSLGLLLCLTAVFFYGCSDDDDDTTQIKKATIKFEKTSTEPVIAYPGDELSFAVNMTATAGIKKVVAVVDTKEIPGSAKEFSDDTETASFSFKYTVKANEVGKTLNFVIEAYDKNGDKSTAEYVVYIQAAKANIVITIPDTAPETVTAGDVIQFDVEVTSELAFRYITTYLNNAELTDLRKETFSDPNTDTYSFSYTTTDLDGGQDLTFVFEVMNENGGIVRTNYQVNVERAVELDINEFKDVNIGAQKCTAFGPYFNSVTGEVYFQTGSMAKSADIDITFFYSGGSSAFILVAPSDITMNTIFVDGDKIADWTIRNDTKLKDMTMTPNEFLAINSKAAIQNAYDNSPSAEVSKTGKLAIGSVVAFKTVAGKYGVMIMRSHTGGKNTNYATFDIKVEK